MHAGEEPGLSSLNPMRFVFPQFPFNLTPFKSLEIQYLVNPPLAMPMMAEDTNQSMALVLRKARPHSDSPEEIVTRNPPDARLCIAFISGMIAENVLASRLSVRDSTIEIL
jgi:hypothetical protein